MIKVCFLSWHFATPEIFLEYLIKMTPGRSGKWKDMVAVTNPFEADFCPIYDGYTGQFPQERAIYLGQHPDIPSDPSPSFRTFDNQKFAARVRLDKHLNAGEWWLDYTYDELTAMKPPTKTKDLACIMTYQTHRPLYTQRVNFMAVSSS